MGGEVEQDPQWNPPPLHGTTPQRVVQIAGEPEASPCRTHVRSWTRLVVVDFQSTLFDTPTSFGPLHALSRRELGAGAWVDVLPAWMPRADEVFAALRAQVPWRTERRRMYDNLVDVPRLVHTYMIGEELPHPLLTEARDALSEHYLPELGETFRTAGLLLLPRRPGLGRLARRHPRPRQHPRHHGGHRLPRRRAAAGPAAPWRRRLDQRDHGPRRPLVMGGSCQRTWEHAVPKVTHAGPRISVQFRPFNVF